MADALSLVAQLGAYRGAVLAFRDMLTPAQRSHYTAWLLGHLCPPDVVTCTKGGDMHVHWVRPGLAPFEQSLNKQQATARWRLDAQFERLLICVAGDSLPDEPPEVLQAFLERILLAEGGIATAAPSSARASFPATYKRESIVGTTSFAHAPGALALALAGVGGGFAGLERPSVSSMRQSELIDALSERITDLGMYDSDDYDYDDEEEDEEDEEKYGRPRGANFDYTAALMERELYGPQRALLAAPQPKPAGQGKGKAKRKRGKGKGKKKN